MHLFESWFCKPKLDIELCLPDDFDILERDKASYSIEYVCDTEVNSADLPFKYAAKFFGETRHSLLYPTDFDSKKMFLIAPTRSEPRKLDLEMCGKSHMANHLGVVLTQAILNLPVPGTKDISFYITLSDQIKKLIETVEEEFLLGLSQRSVSHKIKKNSKLGEKSKSITTCVFNQNDFSENQFQEALSMTRSMSVTRSLINMPANELNPETYEACARFLVESHNDKSKNKENHQSVEIEVFDVEHLQTLGCGLICAVGKGSAVPPRLIKLTYCPKYTESDEKFKRIALIGKGITFDSGGYGIKPASFMRSMKKDMGGSASAIGAFFACANLQLPVHLTCYLAVAENMISSNAMRPGDIYQAHNGLQVEIDHTDAEGRLVLADALSLAADQKPDWIIDLATLTGAARSALGPLVDPMFGNRSSLNQLLYNMGIELGDWVWQLPLPSQYNAYFESRTADIMNSSTTPYGGAITAALFLQKFVGTCAWNHIDTFMWCDGPNGMWGEGNAPSAKCVRLITKAIERFLSVDNNV